MILTLPNGSAIDAAHVAAITWDKFRPGEYGSPACIRVFTTRDSTWNLGGGKSGLEQTVWVPMADDEAAEKACRQLVDAWTGKALQPADATVS